MRWSTFHTFTKIQKWNTIAYEDEHHSDSNIHTLRQDAHERELWSVCMVHCVHGTEISKMKCSPLRIKSMRIRDWSELHFQPLQIPSHITCRHPSRKEKNGKSLSKAGAALIDARFSKNISRNPNTWTPCRASRNAGENGAATTYCKKLCGYWREGKLVW